MKDSKWIRISFFILGAVFVTISYKYLDGQNEIAQYLKENRVTSKIKEDMNNDYPFKNKVNKRDIASYKPFEPEIKKHVDKKGLENKMHEEVQKIQIDNKNYTLLRHLVAVPKQYLEHYDFDEILEKKNGLYIIKGNGAIKDEQSFWIIHDHENNEKVILTGVIKVKVQNSDIFNQLISKYNLEIDQKFEHLNLIYFKSSNFEELVQVTENIKSQTGVVRANLEILKSGYQAK